jgi:very-short-patch-repair endonuclease
MWTALRSRRFHGYKFRRQQPLGRYIVDFVCFDHHLILELDGGQHNTPAAKAYDTERTVWLASEGFRLIRVWNHEVFLDAEAVAELLWKKLHESA